jgi:hypothetical protein
VLRARCHGVDFPGYQDLCDAARQFQVFLTLFGYVAGAGAS